MFKCCLTVVYAENKGDHVIFVGKLSLSSYGNDTKHFSAAFRMKAKMIAIHGKGVFM